MLKKSRWVGAGLTLAAVSALASFSLGAGSAEAAAVYCKTAGVPQGCIVRPTVPPAAVATAAVATAGVRGAGVGVARVTHVTRITRVRIRR
jgi:hypothetical protein